MTVLITTSSFGAADETPLELLRSHGLEPVLNPLRRKLTEEEALSLIREHAPVGLIAGVEPLTRRVLTAAHGLKVVSRAGIGMDSVDQEAAAELGITVRNTPDAPTQAVAELALCMILSLLRRVQETDASIRRGEWLRPVGNLLAGKTVGLIGCGRIGQRLSELLAPFGCTILGSDPCPAASVCFSLVPLPEILENAHVVSLHMPYSEAVHHIIGDEAIGSMRPDAILVNTSRGGLVDEDALARALAEQRIAGAGIDCYEAEPYNGPLTDAPNTLLTSHIGSYAREGRILMERQAAENLIEELETAGAI